MKQRYLEVTFRKGKPFAAYLYLPRRSRVRVTRTLDAGHGLRVDFDDQGTRVGIEITAPNAVFAQHGVAGLDADEWAPLAA